MPVQRQGASSGLGKTVVLIVIAVIGLIVLIEVL